MTASNKQTNPYLIIRFIIIPFFISMRKGIIIIMICGPPAEFRRVSMHCLLHWSGQQQHLLQQLQSLGTQEMQWAQALDKGP